jgi:hypothetical protein
MISCLGFGVNTDFEKRFVVVVLPGMKNRLVVIPNPSAKYS